MTMPATNRVLLLTFGVVAALGVALMVPPDTLGQDAAEEPALPTLITVSSGEQALYRIAIPALRGDTLLGAQGSAVIANDLELISLFKVLDAESFVADLDAEGLTINPDSWSNVGAQGVIKGRVVTHGNAIDVQMRLFELARGTSATLEKTYSGPKSELRAYMHDFASEVVRVLTGEAAAFGTKLTFARRLGPGQKDVYVADFDGANVSRVSRGRGVSMLPNWGNGAIWYSILSPAGMYITRSGLKDKPVVRGNGLNMGVAPCGNRLLFTSTRSGDSEIYSSDLNGGDVKRLTNHPGIDVSPACGPGGQVAFVSNRHGSPQIFTMSMTGGNVKRVTYKGAHNQTPAWCQDPKRSLIAFTGRDEGLDVFTLDLKSGKYTRLTQGQGQNKDPTFSPDCRMIAFASTRGGIFISNPEGLNQKLVVRGAAETVRWSH